MKGSYNDGKRIKMRLFVLFVGGFYLNCVSCVIQSSVDSNTNGVKQTYKVVLSNSGPVIPGSNITFQAHLEDEHGLLPSDLSIYKFKWSSTADDYKVSIDANKNSTWNRCFSAFVKPDEYHVSVEVVELVEIFEKWIAWKSQPFILTDMLNGNINVTQHLKHRHSRQDEPIYSTNKNITFKLNLTDSVLHDVKLYHECDWFVDGEFIGNTTNTTEIETLFADDAGVHNVSAFLRFYEIPGFCDNEPFFTFNRSGQFEMKIHLKDPVEAVIVRGNSAVKLHHALTLNVFYSGSPPFNSCWSLQPVANQSLVLNQSCSIEHVEHEQNFTIYMNKTSLVPGQYVINLTISNDVSLVEKTHFVTVNNEPLPYHSPADVLIPVVGSLIAVTLFLALTIFVVNKRMAQKHVETANFDFHNPTMPLVNSGAHEQSFMEKLQTGLFRIFGDSAQDHPSRRTNSMQSSQHLYGSCDNSLQECA